MRKNHVNGGLTLSTLARYALTFAFRLCLLVNVFGIAAASAQTSTSASAPTQLPANWREIKDGVGGYPAGPMLEIAVRRTHSDKLEMFKWRSEFISMLSAQPGPLVEREWHSLSSTPAYSGTGTWTGMTWWENQQRWQDMANMVFTSPVAANWLKTIDMTMLFVKPTDDHFSLRTLAQSGTQVLELGLLAFPATSADDIASNDDPSAEKYLDALQRNGVETHRFAVYSNPTGFVGPYTVAYNKNGPPASTGEKWFVYMATYESPEVRKRLHATDELRQAYAGVSNAMIKDHSDIEVMERTTSQVCIKKETHTCSLDPDECKVGVMGSGDTWAASCGEAPKPCNTEYGIQSMLSPKTCSAIGGKRIDVLPQK